MAATESHAFVDVSPSRDGMAFSVAGIVVAAVVVVADVVAAIAAACGRWFVLGGYDLPWSKVWWPRLWHTPQTGFAAHSNCL